MTMSASFGLSSSTCFTGQQVTALLTVSNSGAQAVTVRGINPIASGSGQTNTTAPLGLGTPNIGPQQDIVVPASGSSTFQWGVNALAPSIGTSTSMAFDVGCTVNCSDGSTLIPTAATLTVSSPDW